ncbi:MAG: serine/threonine-protein kinase [Polyangiaceae bacterium]
MFHPHGLQPGTIFCGDFRIERALAMGGMGAVYVVEQLSTGRKRALKLLLPSLVENPRSRERFEQEARVASRINSDHVVEVVAAGVDPESGAPWLAMELLEGETLAQRIERAGPLRREETLEVMRQLCHALGAAHASGLVHRDVKPENIYLAMPRREGIPFTLKILDFGIAKLTEDVRGAASATGAVGSPLWMAPEQTGTTGVGPPTDVWALGLVVFHCLTGRLYWRSAEGSGATLQGLLKEVMLDPLVPAAQRATEFGVAANLPAGFDAWFSHTVARDPASRFPDASHALAALQSVLAPLAPTLSLDAASATHVPLAPARASVPSIPEGLGPTGPVLAQTATAPTTAPRGSSGLEWLLGGLGLLLVGGLALALVGGLAFGFYYTQDSEPPKPTAASSTPVRSPAVEPPAASAAQPTPAGATETATSGKRAATSSASAAASGSPAATATATGSGDPQAVSMKDVSDHPARDYKLPWYKQKITQCWKGNEGAKPDAGSYSCTVSVKLNELGQASSIIVSPRTYPKFGGCVVMRTSDHPWGRGPPETKSFSFSF